MSEKERVAELQREVARLSVKVETVIEQVVGLALLGQQSSLNVGKLARLVANSDAYAHALICIVGFGLSGEEAVRVFNAVRDSHKSTNPDEHEPEQWKLPAWLAEPAALAPRVRGTGG